MSKHKIVEETCVVLSSGATTIPAAIRRALGIETGGKITFRIGTYDRVSVWRAAPQANDPVVSAFLNLIQQDIAGGKNLRDLPAGASMAMRNLLARKRSG
jgi:antitoxin PrlF